MGALLVLDAGRALFVSELDALTPHQAAADALLVGLEGPFTIERDGQRETTELCVVPGRTEHALDFHGRRMACLYFEPGTRAPQRLDLAGLRARLDTVMRDAREATWSALLDETGFERCGPVDARAAQVARALARSPDENVPAVLLAQQVGLSSSRLEHLFTRSYGVPLRAWRSWWRMRMAAEQLLDGRTLTEAAHAAGFHDSAHFSNTFRQTFGLPPSLVFGRELEGRLIGSLT